MQLGELHAMLGQPEAVYFYFGWPQSQPEAAPAEQQGVTWAPTAVLVSDPLAADLAAVAQQNEQQQLQQQQAEQQQHEPEQQELEQLQQQGRTRLPAPSLQLEPQQQPHQRCIMCEADMGLGSDDIVCWACTNTDWDGMPTHQGKFWVAVFKPP